MYTHNKNNTLKKNQIIHRLPCHWTLHNFFSIFQQAKSAYELLLIYSITTLAYTSTPTRKYIRKLDLSLVSFAQISLYKKNINYSRSILANLNNTIQAKQHATKKKLILK